MEEGGPDRLPPPRFVPTRGKTHRAEVLEAKVEMTADDEVRGDDSSDVGEVIPSSRGSVREVACCGAATVGAGSGVGLSRPPSSPPPPPHLLAGMSGLARPSYPTRPARSPDRPQTTSLPSSSSFPSPASTSPPSSPSPPVPTSPPSDAFDRLYEAIEARLRLTSHSLLLLTRILKEMRKPPPHLFSTSSPTSLLPSLTDALHDADATHAELITLRTRLLSLPPNPHLSSHRRKRRKKALSRLSEDVDDVSSRFSQIRQVALDKMKPPSQQAHEMEAFTSPPPPSHLPLTYQQDTHPLLLIPDSQEPFDAERDAAERATFIEDIERDVSLVHSLFVDLHDLVGVQGEVVDRLEGAIGRTHLSTRQAVDEIFKAERYARQRRQRVCCMWMTGILLTLFAIALLYITR